MAIITPIDSNLFRRRRQELVGHEPQQVADNRMTTAQGLSLIPSAINLAGQLTTPIVSGIAEYARKQREQEAIDQAKAAQAEHEQARLAGEADLTAGKAAMKNALAERMAIDQPAAQPTAAAEIPSAYAGQPGAIAKAVGQEQGAGGAFSKLLGDRSAQDAAFDVQPKVVPPAAAAAYAPPSDQSFAQGLDQTLGNFENKIRAIAERRVIPAIERREPEAAYSRPRAPIEVPVEGRVDQFPQQASPPILGRQLRSVAAEPDVAAPAAVPLTIDEIRRNAMQASISENPEDRRKVLDQLTTLGEAAYAPQSWSEIFNPTAAKERVQAEIMQMMQPQRGAMSDLESQRLRQQIANYGSMIASRDQKAAVDALLAPYKVKLADLNTKLKDGAITKQQYDTEIAAANAGVAEQAAQANVDLNLARTELAKAQTGLAGVQATIGVPAQAKANLARAAYEGMNAGSRRIAANAADWRAHHPNAPWANYYIGIGKSANTELSRLDAEDRKLDNEQSKLQTRLKSFPPEGTPTTDPRWNKAFTENKSWLSAKGPLELIQEVSRMRGELAGVQQQRADIAAKKTEHKATIEETKRLIQSGSPDPTSLAAPSAPAGSGNMFE